MATYSLPPNTGGSELIRALEQAALHFSYDVETRSLRMTHPRRQITRLDYIWPRSKPNRMHEGVLFENVDERVQIVEIRDNVNGACLWTAETILDPERNYEEVDVEMYWSNGLVSKIGLRPSAFLDAGVLLQDRPLRPANLLGVSTPGRILIVKSAVDGLVGKARDILCN